MEEDGGGFIVRLFKDNYTEEILKQKGLNDRQINALLYYREQKEITSSEYMKKYNLTDRMSRYDLSDLVEKGLLIKEGDKKSAKYIYTDFR